MGAVVPYESDDQITVIEWCKLHGILVNHTANEGKRTPWQGNKLKKMGLSKGFPDISILEPRGKYHGLYIEMKRKGNKPTTEQIEWLRNLKSKGYATGLCYSASDAIALIEKYINIGG